MARPINNLPPESQPWARDTDDKVYQLEVLAGKNAQDTSNSFRAVNGALDRLALQIADLNSITDSLEAQQIALANQQASLTAQQAQINATVSDLAARVTVSTSVANFNTGILPADAIDHPYGPSLPITINIPTGKVIVTVGCGQATVSAGGGGGGCIAEATFTIPGIVNYGDVYARVYNIDGAHNAGSSMVVSRAFTVPPGVHTITGQMTGWASGTGASINFGQPYLTVQVTG